MTNSKATKKALFMSMMSLLLCFTMLMGATFAWFTDTVKSTNNRIVAGNLKVDLVMDKEENGNYESIKNGNGDIFSELTGGNGINWEPGKTEIVYLGVRNLGSLAFKYNIILDIIDEGLIGSLEYAIIAGAQAEDIKNINNWEAVKAAAIATGDANATGDLPKGQVIAAENGVLDDIAADSTKEDETDYFALAVHMKEEAGNEYQNKGVQIDVTVVATQVEAEEDSFGPEYDANAGEAVDSTDALVAAILKGGTYKLEKDLTIDVPLTIPEGTRLTINLGNNTITGTHPKSAGAVIINNGNLTINGGTVSSTAANGGSAIQNKGTLTVNDSTLNGAPNEGESWPAYTVNNTGLMTISNAKITSVHGAVASYGEGAVVTLNNTDIDMSGIPGFTSHGIYAYSNGSVIVNGGNIKNNAADQNTTGGSVINGAVTVNSGNFTGRIEAYYGTPVIKGGTFSVDPKKFVSDDYVVTKNEDDTWTVGELPVASVDGNYFTSLADAIGSISSTDPVTVTLNKDIKDEYFAVPAKADITIDLNGNDMTFTKDKRVFCTNAEGEEKGEWACIAVSYGSTLTIKNGEINNSTSSDAIFANYGTLNINGGSYKVTSGEMAAMVISNNANGAVNVTGATLETNGKNIPVNNEGTMKLTGCVIKSTNPNAIDGAAIDNNATLTLENCIVSNAKAGYHLIGHHRATAETTILSGTYTTAGTNFVSSGSYIVKGGTFNVKPNGSNVKIEGNVVDNTDDTWTVQ